MSSEEQKPSAGVEETEQEQQETNAQEKSKGAEPESSESGGSKDSSGEPVVGTGEHDWLEEVASESNLDWVREQNKQTLSRLGNPEDCAVYDRVLAILDSKEKIPTVRFFARSVRQMLLCCC